MGNLCCADKANQSGKFYVKSQGRLADLKKQYKLNTKKMLGEGSFGKVYKANSIEEPDLAYAIKQIKKPKGSETALNELRREINIMQTVDHPHIIKYYETYEEENYIYLVMELCENGTLEDKSKKLSEEQAALYMEQCCKALVHCHGLNIIHRDIKPENIMFGKDGECKLIDFGLSLVRSGNYNKLNQAGSPYYFAPEVTKENYGQLCDIWSLGVSFHQVLSDKDEPNCFPFQPDKGAKNPLQSLIKNIQNGQYNNLDNISTQCSKLIRKMIVVDINKRYTAADVLQDPWVTKHVQVSLSNSILREQSIDSIKQFKGKSMLKRELISILVRQMSHNQVQELRAEFENFDTNQNGLISMEEMKTGIINMNVKLGKEKPTDEEMQSILFELDHNQNNEVNYTEFLSATLDLEKILTPEKINQLFNCFDLNVDGEIKMKEIQTAFTKFGKELSDEDLKQIMESHDLNNDQVISKDEFQQIFK